MSKSRFDHLFEAWPDAWKSFFRTQEDRWRPKCSVGDQDGYDGPEIELRHAIMKLGFYAGYVAGITAALAQAPTKRREAKPKKLDFIQ